MTSDTLTVAYTPTEYEGHYPPYLNIRIAGDSARIFVRGPGQDSKAGDGAEITVPLAELAALRTLPEEAPASSDKLAQELEAIDARLREMPMPFDLHPAVNDLLRVWEKAGASIIEALRVSLPEDAVERAAVALYECERERSNYTDKVLATASGKPLRYRMEHWDDVADLYRDDARAALAALRAQPSPEQTEPSATHSEMLGLLNKIVVGRTEQMAPYHRDPKCLCSRCAAPVGELRQWADAALAKLDQPTDGRAA